MQTGKYVYLCSKEDSTYEPTGIEELFVVKPAVGGGSHVQVIRSSPDGNKLELNAILSADSGAVSRFDCKMMHPIDGQMTATFDFEDGRVHHSRSRDGQELERGTMELPENAVIYPLGLRWFSGRVIQAIASSKDGKCDVFTAKVSHLKDEDLFAPQFDNRAARCESTEAQVGRYVVTGGPYVDAPFWIDTASGALVRYRFSPGGNAGEWLVELCHDAKEEVSTQRTGVALADAKEGDLRNGGCGMGWC
jgi:hypothetical protein